MSLSTSLGTPESATIRHPATENDLGNRLKAPLKYSGALDEYEAFDVTPVIGREFPTVQLTELLSDDAKIRDLAVTVSRRGVCFFRNQDIQIEDQKRLAQKLGELTGKPETSKLHKHAIGNEKNPGAIREGKVDNELMIISADLQKKYHKEQFVPDLPKLASDGWHSDITFERVPCDYAILKMLVIPEDRGGDTLWASGYEAYDRLSPAWRTLAERLTATHHHPTIPKIAQDAGLKVIDKDRGSPANSGTDFKASHPVVRTHPVTGWKSLFAAGQQIHHGAIDGVTDREDKIIKAYFLQLLVENHDLQVRFRWNKNDVAIWDNRCTFHTATFDYDGARAGDRILSIGEKPYFDPKSVSRREALSLSGAKNATPMKSLL